MKRKIALLAALALVVTAGGLLVGAAQHVGLSQGYEPEQPIAFSHEIHAGANHIPCLYCHFGAEKSRHAGIPPMNVCMNCHSRLKVSVFQSEVEKLKEAYEQKRAVRWTKIHNLPDFVYFNHSQHVLHGIACQKCHGPVETMSRVRQEATLAMGWCINCHRQYGVLPPSQRGAGAVRGSTHAAIGGTDCGKCHY
ncbi:MAG: cytochrome c family protein [Acidobacteriota bacterium]|nr:cytochrome c family protein [Acidobacteriota bacterium]